MHRSVLIITYYWPPAGGPGVQRWLKFASYLPQEGITPIIYCPKNAHYPIIDPTLKDDIPDNITILKRPIFEPLRFSRMLFKNSAKRLSTGIIPVSNPSSIERLLLWIRGHLFVPDARKYWIKPSVKFLRKYIHNNRIDTVITTGPPHSMHLIGSQLKSHCDIRWLADFRDPWTTIGYHQKFNLKSRIKQKHIQLEHQILNEADAITVTSPDTLEEFKSKTSQPIHLVTNGFDPKDFSKKINRSEKFSLAHVGSLLSERNPILLWEILAELINSNASFGEDLELRFAGTRSQEVLCTLEDYGLTQFVRNFNYITHQKAIEMMSSSQVLLLIEIDRPDTSAIVPGKLFEYLGAKRPIIGIGPKDWAALSIIRKSNAGQTFTYQQKQQLQSHLLSLYKLYKNEGLDVPLSDVSQYDRHHLTKQLVDVLKNDLWE